MDQKPSDPLGRSAAEKLAQPKLMSNYQKERNAQEAKKREEEAANAAALRDFENEFGVDDDRDRRGAGSYRGPAGPRGFDGPGRYNSYHDRRRSPERYGSGPPLSMKRKRQLEDQRERDAAYHESKEWQSQTTTKRPREDYREERPAAGPTVYITELPPNIQTGQLKAVLSPFFTVQSISLRAPSKDSAGKRSIAAIVNLAAGTSTSTIDNAVDKLRNHYIGCGYTMTLSRSAPIANLHPRLGGRGSELPFGATEAQDRAPVRGAAPHGAQNRFAPPEQYENRERMVKDIEVDLDQSLDLATMRAIHRLADEFLAFPKDQAHKAMEMEALFMRLPEVQNDPNFAFLYDSRSLGGLYYRYCLWAPTLLDIGKTPSLRLFMDRQSLVFRRPSSKRAPFNGLTDLAQAIDDPDYASSDEEGDGDEQQVLPHEMKDDMRTTLSPLHRARFAHLLARLPPNKTMLRHGDVARVTNFAIAHAATGIEDIVDMMVLNVAKPFSLLSVASSNALQPSVQQGIYDDEDYNPNEPLPSIEEAHTDTGTSDDTRPTDPSSAMHVGLLIISDILGAIHTADGAKNAWRFRGLLEQGLRSQKIFETLGQLDRQYSWGKLTADAWKRRTNALFDIWDAQLCFSKDVVDDFRATFNHEQAEVKKETAELKVPAWRIAKPKSVPHGHIRVLGGGTVDAAEHAKAYAKSKEVAPAVEEKVEVAPAVKEIIETAPVAEESATQPAQVHPKKRLRAEDMFADEEW